MSKVGLGGKKREREIQKDHLSDDTGKAQKTSFKAKYTIEKTNTRS